METAPMLAFLSALAVLVAANLLTKRQATRTGLDALHSNAPLGS